jgi:lysozyme|tara:strand:+ start:1709 stop:2374 length:666 start_codon:yes stop_codon:yes gene_type:complete
MIKTVIVGAASMAGVIHYCKPVESVQVATKLVEVPVKVMEYIQVPVEVIKFVEVETYYAQPILVKPNVDWYPEADYDIVMISGVKFFEGFKPKRYKCCAGVPTIGYGCTDKHIVSKGSIDEITANRLLVNELTETKHKVRSYVKVSLTENQLNALTSFAFNCGMTNLKKLVNGHNRLNEGNYESVERLLPMYRKAGGKVRKGLVKRRSWELGLWKGDTQIL